MQKNQTWRRIAKFARLNSIEVIVAFAVVLIFSVSIVAAQTVDRNSASDKNPSSNSDSKIDEGSKSSSGKNGTPNSTASNSASPGSSSGPQTQPAVYQDNWQSSSQPLSTCQLQETQNITGAGAKGFPARQSIPSTGNIKIAIIPVDFSNAVGSGDPQALFGDDVKKIVSWAQYFSRGKLSYEVALSANSWIRAPQGADWYTCASCGKGAPIDKQPRQAAIQELITAADPVYDFSGVDYIYFALPEQAEQQFGTSPIGGGTFSSNEGQFFALTYGEMGASHGVQTDRTKIWDHVIHEILHAQGFIGHGPSNGSGYYITTDQWGPSKAITSWEGFLNGWFGSNEILCLNKDSLNEELYVSMDSLDDFGVGKESIMIRLNSQELLIVERRGPGPFTTLCGGCYRPNEKGFTAYKINVNAASFRDDSDPNGDSKNFWSYLGVQGKPIITNFVEYSGVRVTRISETQVKISAG